MQDMKQHINEIDSLPDDVDRETIEATAGRLAQRNYSPLLTVDAPDFLLYTKATLKQRCLQIVDDGSDQAADSANKAKKVGLLVNQYKLLQRLRRDDPDAWDLIEELFGED